MQSHIGGALRLLEQRAKIGFGADDLWFNGFRHLPTDVLGVEQAELLTGLIEASDGKIPWNRAFAGDAVVVPERGTLPRHILPGGMILTLLSPTLNALRDLRPAWAAAVNEAEQQSVNKRPRHRDVLGQNDPWPPAPADELPDHPDYDYGEPNGSSIAFIAEYDGRRCLFAADAHAPVLHQSLDRITGETGKISLDAFKLSHHGSRRNIDNYLLERVRCGRYLVSTNNAYHKHPDNDALMRVIQYGGLNPTIVFNYGTERNLRWHTDRNRVQAPDYLVEAPEPGKAGWTVAL
jgi:hypothetical protein